MPEPRDEAVRRRLQRQKVANTKPELRIRQRLHAMGLRYRVGAPVDPGVRSRADVVFRAARVAVYVDGCFWHGCPQHFVPPKNNADWWAGKIASNRARDQSVTVKLEALGWKVMRFWEHESPEVVAEMVRACVRERSGGVN